MRCSTAAGLTACTIALFLPTEVPASDGFVVARARDGACELVVSGELAIFEVVVTGLVPDEVMTFESVSNGERMISQEQAAPDGTYRVTLFAAVAGHETGTDTVTIEASRCRLSATFPWSTIE